MKKAMMHPWDYFGPYPVVVVITPDSDSLYHAAPFSWVVPTDKEGGAMIMMRNTSRSLANINQQIPGSLIISLSWLGEIEGAAQAVLLSKAEKPVPIKKVVDDTLSFPVAGGYLAAVKASITEVRALKRNYSAVFVEFIQGVSYVDNKLRLVHFSGKLFGGLTRFEAKGYNDENDTIVQD